LDQKIPNQLVYDDVWGYYGAASICERLLQLGYTLKV